MVPLKGEGRDVAVVHRRATVLSAGRLPIYSIPNFGRILPELAKRISGHLTAIRLNADETGTGLDFVDQASVVIAHVIDSAADRSRN